VHRSTQALVRYRGDGTLDVVAGSFVAGVAAYLYQMLGGRVLGAADFAPVSALLTVHFLVFVVILLPVEQVVIRRLTLDRTAPGIPVAALTAAVAAGLAAGAFAAATRDRFFGGDLRFVLVVIAGVATHTLFAVARGYLAGNSRFRSYGMASGAAALVRLAISGVVLVLVPGGLGLGIALVAGPLVVAAWRPFSPGVDETDHSPVARVDPGVTGGLLSGLVLAAAASQSLLLAGPLIVGALGGGAATISVVFATFTLFRAPLTFGYNLVARVLPSFTEMAVAGRHDDLARWTRRLAAGAAVLGAVGAVVAGRIGPAVVAAAFGPDFRPEGDFSAVVACGVVLAGGGLFIGQVFVARGDVGRLAAAWMFGAGAGLAALAMPIADPATRVGVGFAVGEAVALAVMTVVAASPVATRGTTRRAGGRVYAAAKRMSDLAVAFVLLVVLSPVLLVVAVAIRVESGRPVLFRQVRVGRGGGPFRLVKFRTMVPGADETPHREHRRRLAESAEQGNMSMHDDDRVTRLGRLLRAASLDELPNLWNVLVGDMSLVGPRPLVPYEQEMAARLAPGGDRLSVRPGITGLAQVSGRDDISMADRARLDAEYVANRSLSLDLAILGRTVAALVRHPGV
jgi:lipopolysaccharide/colanic/teichoic acid biosynthesis glycosyltransferase